MGFDYSPVKHRELMKMERDRAAVGVGIEKSTSGREPTLLDMSRSPLLYSPAFYPFYMDLMSQPAQAEFTCGG